MNNGCKQKDHSSLECKDLQIFFILFLFSQLINNFNIIIDIHGKKIINRINKFKK